MKEIISSAYNYLARIPEPGKPFTAEVEVALTVSEVDYQTTNDDALSKLRKCETYRFVGSPARLRQLAKSITQAADEAETDLSEALREVRNPTGHGP